MMRVRGYIEVLYRRVMAFLSKISARGYEVIFVTRGLHIGATDQL